MLLNKIRIFSLPKMIPFVHHCQKRMVHERVISIGEWRRKRKRFSSRLTEMPDWSYLDGRGYGPPSFKQSKKYLFDQELAKTVVERMKELEEAQKS